MKPYNISDYEPGEGTFRKNKLINKEMKTKKGYHLNTDTYELEEIE